MHRPKWLRRIARAVKQSPQRLHRLAGASGVKTIASCIAGSSALVPAAIVWDYGGVLPWSQWVACWAVVVLAILSIPFLFVRVRGTLRIQWLIPMLAATVFGIGWAQTQTLPSSLGRWVSPATDAAYRDWVPESIRIEATQNDPEATKDFNPERHPSTVCRSTTQRSLIPYALSAVVITVLMLTVRDQQSLVIMLVIVAIAGTSVATYGLLNTSRIGPASGATSWSMTANAIESSFGPFINRNNAGGYLNLTLAATLGLFVWTVRKSNKRATVDPTYVIPPSNKWERIVFTLSSLVKNLDGPAIIVLAAMVIQTVAIAASHSRGALVAAVAGGTIATWQLARRQRSVSPAIVATVIVLVVLGRFALVYLGLDGSVGQRVDSIFTLSEGSQVGRLELIVDGMRAAVHYLPFGSGIGTYQYAALPFQGTSAGIRINVHADSMPVEWFVEGGIWIIVIIGLAITVMVSSLSKMAARQRSHLVAVAAMGWFVMVSQLVACCFDFGIMLPANYLTASVLVGAFLGMIPKPTNRSEAHSSPRTIDKPMRTKSMEMSDAAEVDESGLSPQPTAGTTRFLAAVVAVTFSAIVALTAGTMLTLATSHAANLAHESRTTYQVQQWFRNEANEGSISALKRLRPGFSPTKLIAIKSIATNGLTNDRIAPHIGFLTSLAILEEQESASANAGKSVTTKAGVDQVDLATLVDVKNDPRLSVRRMITLGKVDVDRASNSVALLEGQDVDQIRLARQLAIDAMVRCPLHPFIRIPIIRTDFVTAGAPSDGPNADLTRQLATDLVRLQSGNPDVIDRAIRWCFVFPGPESIEPFVHRFLSLRPSRFDAMWPLIRVIPDPESIQGSIPDRLDAVLFAAESRRVPEEFRQAMLDRAEALLQTRPVDSAGDPMADDEIAFASARISMAKGRTEEAIEAMDVAVRLSPSNWRYRDALVAALIVAKRHDEAAKHLQRAILQRPTDQRLQQQLQGLRKDRD
ncbi:O-antigen ligase family protein [Rubripirellula tenax]|nr:O-antigen ligase family protein [Rubripirellula tenax]